MSISIWRAVLRQNFTDWKALLSFIQLEEAHIDVLKNSKFPLNLPRRLAEKIAKNTPNDPILQQFLPVQKETKISENFVMDPVDDSTFQKQKKLLKKYHGRALLIVTSACAMNCRFCFRQNFDYQTEDKLFDKEIEEIRQDPSITEIILSGGDPLSWSNKQLSDLFQRLSSISHLKRLRFHTRFPIGIPERIDAGFLNLLASTKLQIFFIIHSNHPKELDEDVLAAMKQIQFLGIPVLNQNVLLRGVNDDLETLSELYQKMIDHGILPYYLHQLDRVQGAAHFEVSEEKGLELIRQLNTRLSGYGVPKYVKEIPGEESKTGIQVGAYTNPQK